MTDLEKLFGERTQLITLDLIYRKPDHPWFLQQFVWQTYDRIPDLPRVERFVDFWQREIEAAIHSLTVAVKDPGGRPLILTPAFVTELHP